MQWLDCKSQFDTGFSVIVTDIRERRFEVVDRTTGLAFGWGYFDHNGTPEKFSRTLDKKLVDVMPTFRQPFSFYIAEVFKVVDGDSSSNSAARYHAGVRRMNTQFLEPRSHAWGLESGSVLTYRNLQTMRSRLF